MTIKQKKAELRKKIQEAKDEKELAELRRQVEVLEDLEDSENHEIDKIDERDLLNGAEDRLEKRRINMSGAEEIEKPQKIGRAHV